MIYVSARFANAEHTQIVGTDANGNTETVPHDHKLFRQPDDGPTGFVANGGVIDPYVVTPVTLPDLAPYQFRAMLKLSGKQDDLYAVLDAMPEPNRTVAQSKLEYSLTFKRDNDLVLSAKQALGLTEAELDEMWIQAASII